MSYFESLLSQSGIAIAPAQVQVPAASKEAPPVEPIEVEAFRELGPDGRPLPGDAPSALPGAQVGPQERFKPGSEDPRGAPRHTPSMHRPAPESNHKRSPTVVDTDRENVPSGPRSRAACTIPRKF